MIQYVKVVLASREGASPSRLHWDPVTHARGPLIGSGRPGRDSGESAHYILNRKRLIVRV